MPTIVNIKLCLALQPAVILILFVIFANAALDPIVIVGSHFFYKTSGKEFFIRGVSYSLNTGGEGIVSGDSLADQASCQRDIPYLQKLTTNVVSVNEVDPTKDHSGCMALLDAAGIYVLVDLSNPATGMGINGSIPVWDVMVYESFTSVIDSMQNYSNVLGFFVGNGVITDVANSISSAYVKAAVRDMKSYIQAQAYRSMGIGYASDYDASIISDLEAYLNCGDRASSIDFLGLNVFSWCGDSSYAESGYSVLTASLSNYSVPVFFSQYGCNIEGGGAAGRQFTEVAALYGPQMAVVFSGGIVYEYNEYANDYGLVSVSGSAVSTLADFNAFSTQMAAASPSSTASSAYTPSNTVAASCPTTGSTWLASEILPPFPNSALCDCMLSSVSCVASPVLTNDEIATLFGDLCANSTICSGIATNATTGKYGAYSVCNTTALLSWAMNQYYLSQNNASTNCGFGGQANFQSPSSTGTQCQMLLAQAGPQGTGTLTSLPSSTGKGTSTGTTSSSYSTRTGTPPGGSGGATSSGGGLNAGAKAGIAIATILIATILAGIGVYIWRRKSKMKDPPNFGEGGLEVGHAPPFYGQGGLEVGDAPPEFTALRKAEMEAKEASKPHIITGEHMDHGPEVHEIQLDGNELDASVERQELGSNGTITSFQPTHAELNAAANLSELSDAGVPFRGELSGDSTRRSELSPKRKPVSGSASPGIDDPTSQYPPRASWSNSPWSNPGVERFGAPHVQSAEEVAEAAEMRRIEEEERRIDEAIAESERLQALRRQKEELQKRKLEMMARGSGGSRPGGSSNGPN